MKVVLNFKGLSERDIEKFVRHFKWRSWSHSTSDEELSVEVNLKDFFPSEVLERVKRIEVEEETEARAREIERWRQ